MFKMYRTGNITRIEDLFPEYAAIDKSKRDQYSTFFEEKMFKNDPIKEAFISYYDSLIFTKIGMNKDLSIYRANIVSDTTKTRYFVFVVVEYNGGITRKGTQKYLRDFIREQWISFQSAE